MLNDASQLICNSCHSIVTVYQEELGDFMPGVAIRGRTASSRNAFDPVKRVQVEREPAVTHKRIKLADSGEVALAVRLLTNILALQASALEPYVRNHQGVCSAVKEILLCCLYDEEWIKKYFLRYGFRMEITLAILSLSCFYHREFMLPCHLAEKATLGEIPYLNVYSKLKIQGKKAKLWKRTFETRTFPSASAIQKEARSLLSDPKHCWPPLRDSIGNFLNSVSGYHDFPCSCSVELSKSLVEYFEFPQHFLNWMFFFSVCRRISQEKGLEPCGEIDVLCDLLNLLKLSLICHLDHCILKKGEVSEDNCFALFDTSLSPHDFLNHLIRLKEKKTLYYRIYHNDWYGVSDDDVYKLSQLYENVIVGKERVVEAYLPVLSALKDLIHHSPFAASCPHSSHPVWNKRQEEELDKKQLEDNPWNMICTILSEFVELGLRYLGRENTERLKRYVIQVSDAQLHGILVLLGLVKDERNETVLQTQQHFS
jgi:hypothetical protein